MHPPDKHKTQCKPKMLNTKNKTFLSKSKSSSGVRMFCDFTTNETSYSLRAPEVSFPKSSLSCTPEQAYTAHASDIV